MNNPETRAAFKMDNPETWAAFSQDTERRQTKQETQFTPTPPKKMGIKKKRRLQFSHLCTIFVATFKYHIYVHTEYISLC